MLEELCIERLLTFPFEPQSQFYLGCSETASQPMDFARRPGISCTAQAGDCQSEEPARGDL